MSPRFVSFGESILAQFTIDRPRMFFLQEEDCDDRFDTGDNDFTPSTFDPRCRVWFQDALASDEPIFTDPYQVQFGSFSLPDVAAPRRVLVGSTGGIHS